MSLISRTSFKEIQGFARLLAEKLSKRYPPAIDNSPEKRVSENRLSRVLEETFAQAETFQREKQLGIFAKAKLGNEFKWQLKELGYSARFVEVATEGLMVYVTRAEGKASETAK